MSALKGIEQVLNRFARLEASVDNLEKPTQSAGEYMLASIARNFEAQGRPKWQGLAPSTLAQKKGSKILHESGALENAATSPNALDVTSDGFDIAPDSIYGARHNFGYPGGTGRGRSKTPARAFLLFQPEDEKAILNIFNWHFRTAG